MKISREGFILAQKGPDGQPQEPVGLTFEEGPPSIALISSVLEATQLREELTQLGELHIFKVHVVVVGEVIDLC